MRKRKTAMQKSDLLKYRVPKLSAGRRVRSILQYEFGLSRALIQRLRDNDRVRLDGNPVFLTRIATPGELITVDLDFAEESYILPERMDLDIVGEDQDFLALNKPAGVLIHPVGKEITGTLANGVIHYWLSQGVYAKFRPIHRLDRNTSGLVLIGKNQFAHQSLYNQFHNHSVEREYAALVEGVFDAPAGTVNAPIARKPASIVERWVSPEGQPAITHFQVVETYDKVSLIRLQLETGRTHQIRVHMRHIGHPLLGDTLYGGKDTLITRQALHSCRFQFIHPRSKETVSYTADLTPDLQRLISLLTKGF